MFVSEIDVLVETVSIVVDVPRAVTIFVSVFVIVCVNVSVLVSVIVVGSVLVIVFVVVSPGIFKLLGKLYTIKAKENKPTIIPEAIPLRKSLLLLDLTELI
jgi:hypothetical protein